MADAVFKDVHTKEITIGGSNSTNAVTVKSGDGEISVLLRVNSDGSGVVRVYDASENIKSMLGAGYLILGASAIDDQSIIRCDSTTKGITIPRMTTAQANTMSGAGCLAGAIIYNSTLNKMEVFVGGGWQTITSVAR